MLDASQFVDFACSLADAARAETLVYFRTNTHVTNKLATVLKQRSDRTSKDVLKQRSDRTSKNTLKQRSDRANKDQNFDPVTAADRAAEQVIRNLIQAQFPDHGIRGEEFDDHPACSEYTWVIDPIDGTRAFISGLPVWGILIGLLCKDTPLIGVMDQPLTGERFVGGPHGAFLQHHGQQTPMRVRTCPELKLATLCTTDPYLFVGPEAQAFAHLRQQTRLQRYGLDCYGYSALALGGIDLVVESGLQDYDICALIPVVKAAGGQITSWSGKDASKGGQVIASGDARVHAQVLEILTPFAKD
ncbi:MAG: histidinol-phosphatase [Robiginitomaculum sp.]|nr:histidinol-phosphatase [Robiginitomaculum sp.]